MLDLTLPAHNEALIDDPLYTISLNYQWRKIINGALQFYFRYGDSDLALDNEDLFENLLNDLYTEEAIGSIMKQTIYEIELAANVTVNATSFTQIGVMARNHTFEFPNASVKYGNIRGTNSGNISTHFQAQIDGETIIEEFNGRVRGVVTAQTEAISIFNDLPIGVVMDIHLAGRVTTGNFQILESNAIVLVIEEWE